MGVSWGGVAAVTGLYAAFLLVGWRASRKVKEGTASDLLVAGRAMPLWLASLTMTATWVDGGYLLGTAEGVYKEGLAAAFQPGLCFGISLIVGGLFFAKTMRRHHFTTLIDPFEARYGKHWAAVLFLPALFGEVIWSAELLVALGATFKVILGFDLTTSILASAAVVTAYTMVGGMWSVAYTDAFQLALIPLGLLAALPFAMAAAGGFDRVAELYLGARGEAAYLVPPLQPAGSYWTPQAWSGWWNLTLMLVLGGIPWNCYFQRVLSCQTPVKARWHSILAGVMTILLTVPPLLLGMAAYAYAWGADDKAALAKQPDLALPMLLAKMTPYAVGLLGLTAIIGAVTSSFSSSILSGGSMVSWNLYHRILAPGASVGQLKAVIRASILLLGAGAAALALSVRSVLELWIFTSDLIFVLLFPQLVMALFDPRANRTGSAVAFAVSLALRLGGGEPMFNLPTTLPYHQWFGALLPGGADAWYDSATRGTLFPFRTLAAGAGLVLIPLVSRLTAAWDPPRPLAQNPEYQGNVEAKFP